MTRNGMATNASATTTPAVVNGSEYLTHASRYWPTKPSRPSTSSSATPPTTGGSTSGTVTRVRTNWRPGSSVRASSHASGTPKPRHPRVARLAVINDNCKALATLGSASCVASEPHGASTTNPTSGTTRNANPTTAGSSSTAGTP